MKNGMIFDLLVGNHKQFGRIIFKLSTVRYQLWPKAVKAT